MKARSVVGIVLATVVVTTLAWLLLMNLTLGNKQIDERILTRYAVADPQFRRVMGSLLGPPILEGNRVEALVNGERIFPAMLDAIRGAQHSITFETYIYWSGTIGRSLPMRWPNARAPALPCT